MCARSGSASSFRTAPPQATIREVGTRRRYLSLRMLRSAPRSVRVLVEILVVVVIVAAVYLYAPPIGAVSPEAFQYSLAREVGGAKDGKDRSCVNVRPGVWRCVVDDPAAGGIVFELTRHGRRCWD